MPQLGRSHPLRTALLVLAIFGAGIRRNEATCPNALPEAHFLGAWFENCPDTTPVSASAFLLSNPLGVNSGVNDIVCREAGSLTSQFNDCQPEAGTIGDGHVTLQFDWGGIYVPPTTACPDHAGAPGEAYRTMVHVVHGSGRSIILSLSYQTDFSSYVIEATHPLDGSVFTPLSCADPGRQVLHLDQISAANGSIGVDVTLSAPLITSDCDPGTGGEALGSCPVGPSAIPPTTRGRVYTKTLPCGASTDLRTTGWAFVADPDAQGHVSLSFPAPVEGQCVYVGGTYRMSGQEIPVIAGSLRIPPDDCGESGCDPNDGAIRITMPGSAVVEWQQPQAFSSYNVYRGDLTELRRTGQYTQDPAVDPLAARACGVTGDTLSDAVSLAPGQAVVFHVSGNGPAGESGLGLDSQGHPMPNSNPCP